MRSISAGDVYYLTSPFHSTVDPTHEKKLAYLLGTISSRPVVIIRPPVHWDEYSTVTVIPSLSHGKPGIHISSQDRYGYSGQSSFIFMPHTVHTIPVGRLGRHIGHLSAKEFNEILDAFIWSHNQELMDDSTCPIPKCYREVATKEIPSSVDFWAKHTNVDIGLSVDNNMVLHSTEEATKDMDGVVLDIDYSRAITPTVAEKLSSDPNYQPLSQKESTGKFPPSIFSEDTLNRVADRFTLSPRYFGPNAITTRDPAVLTDVESATIRGELSSFDYKGLLDYYKTMQPFDAFMLGPRLPTSVLAKISNHTIRETTVLKRLCTFLRDLSENEYQERLNAINTSKEVAAAPESTVKPASSIWDTKENLARLQPYLNETKIHKIPVSLQKVFLGMPAYTIKRAYRGKSFQLNYTKAVEMYMKLREENRNG